MFHVNNIECCLAGAMCGGMPGKHKTNLDDLLTERLWDLEVETEASPIFPEVIVLSLLCLSHRVRDCAVEPP